MGKGSNLKKRFLTLLTAMVVLLGGYELAYSMTKVKGWVNQIRPGTFETADATGDAEIKGPRVFTESQANVLTALAKREAELRKKEELNNQRAKELKSLSQQIEQKLDEMRRMTADFERKRKSRKEMDEKDISRMVRYYETMDPERTAVFFNKMDRITAMHLIMRMNPRKASAVLELLEPDVAVDITEKVTQFKRNRSEAVIQ